MAQGQAPVPREGSRQTESEMSICGFHRRDLSGEFDQGLRAMTVISLPLFLEAKARQAACECVLLTPSRSSKLSNKKATLEAYRSSVSNLGDEATMLLVGDKAGSHRSAPIQGSDHTALWAKRCPVDQNAATDLAVGGTLHRFHGQNRIPMHGFLVAESGVEPLESRKNRAIFETKAPHLR